MKHSKSLALLVLLLSVMHLAACAPSEAEPEANGVSEATPEPQAPRVGPVVPFGLPEIRDLQPTVEVVSNCGGITEPVVKHPSLTVGTSHSVEWEIGGTIGVGLQIGSDLAPAKVDLTAALEGGVARDLTNSIQQGNAWDLPAEPGYIMEYTIMWRELWQPGYVDATFLDPEPEILRIDVKYRTGVQSEIVGQKPILCNPDIGDVPPTPTPTRQVEPTDTPSSTISLTKTPVLSAGDLTCVGRENNAFIDASAVPASRWQGDCAYDSVLNGQTILLSTWGVLIQRSGADVISARVIPPNTNVVAPPNSVLFAGYVSQESADTAYRIVNPSSPTPSLLTESSCPISVSQSIVSGWRLGPQTTTDSVQLYLDQFNSYRPTDAHGKIYANQQIPAGVVIAIGFPFPYSSYPVEPLVYYSNNDGNSDKWGLFLTTAEFAAPGDTACLSLEN